MALDCQQLEKQAENRPANLSFRHLERLAECWGYEFRRQKGSHRIYRQEEFDLPRRYALMNFQKVGGQAKAYQVRQLLDAIGYIRDHHRDEI